MPLKIKVCHFGSCQSNHRMQTYALNSLRISKLVAYTFLQRRLKNEIEIPFNNKIIAFVYEFIDRYSDIVFPVY